MSFVPAEREASSNKKKSFCALENIQNHKDIDFFIVSSYMSEQEHTQHFDFVPMLLAAVADDFYSFFFAWFDLHSNSKTADWLNAVLFGKYLPCEAADSILKSNNSTNSIFRYVQGVQTESNCIISRECLVCLLFDRGSAIINACSLSLSLSLYAAIECYACVHTHVV